MAEPLSVAEVTEIQRWVHAMVHLEARKGIGPLPEGEWVAECWMPDTPPGWALDLAGTGAPGSGWCPVLDPTLRPMSEVQDS